MSLETGRWYPVASAHDLPHGHIYRTQLGLHELAIWRDGGGGVNIWEDRCPHRGVRLSLGAIIGDELRCAYHAWHFASGSGACRFIPAQPDRKPAAAIRAVVWPVAEADGLIWTGQDPQGAPPVLGAGEVLRAIPVGRGADSIANALSALPGLKLVLQPQGPDRCTIRGIAESLSPRAADTALEALRRKLEAAPC